MMNNKGFMRFEVLTMVFIFIVAVCGGAYFILKGAIAMQNIQNSNSDQSFQNDLTKSDAAYNEYIKEITPTLNPFPRIIKAFFTGGLVCALGQWITNYAMDMGFNKELSGTICSLILILLSVILTGFGLFCKIADFAGAGVLVPITGFANGVAASAIEYKKEGQVFGIGCKIFTIAGPVILYGVFSSWLLGFIYWITDFIIPQL